MIDYTTLEQMQDIYDLLWADMFDLANKAYRTWWEDQRIIEIEGAIQILRELANVKGFNILEPEDFLKRINDLDDIR